MTARDPARDDGGDVTATSSDGEASVGSERGDTASRLYRWVDARFDLDDPLLGKAFPEDRYASFLLGEVAIASLVVLVVTGTGLGLRYRSSATPVVYHGAAAVYAGRALPQAFASVLSLTYDIPFGMTIRELHHWAAYVFLAAVALHVLRVFFTAAYRNPREWNWVVGAALLALAFLETVTGTALPFDRYGGALAASGFRLLDSLPLVGSTVSHAVTGGSWPADASTALARLFFLHVFFLPALLVLALAVHLLFLVHHKHTHARGSFEAAVTDFDVPHNWLVGRPLLPTQAVISAVVFLVTLAVTAVLAAFFPVQRVAFDGPFDPTATIGGAPDWYLAPLYGVTRLGVPPIAAAGVAVAAFAVFAGWPFLDASTAVATFLADPLDRPAQTAVGVGSISLLSLLALDAQTATAAALVGVPVATTSAVLTACTITLPVAWAVVVYCTLRGV